jgi:hypothetical protein
VHKVLEMAKQCYESYSRRIWKFLKIHY